MNPELLADEAAEIAELEKPETEQKAADPALKPEPQEAKAEAEQPEAEETDNEGQFVRKGDFKALRQKAEAAERAKAEMEARYAADMARLNERLAIIAQQNAQREQPKAPEIPDINTDPIGHFQTKQAILEKQLEEARGFQQQQVQMTQQQAHLQKIGAEVSRLEQEFAKVTPDYNQAQQHLFQTWAQNKAMDLAGKAFDGIWSMLGFAKGGVFSGGRVTPFARGGVVSSPTMFGMSNGLGLMGEAGPEAILPLSRGSGGKLGVVAQGGGALAVSIGFDGSIGSFTAMVRDEAGRVVAMATPQIVSQSVGAVVSMSKKTKSALS